MNGFQGAAGFNTDEDGPKFTFEALVGMRCWSFLPDGSLRSPVQHFEWKPGTNEATDKRYGVAALLHPTCPDRDCSAGFYAYHGEGYWYASDSGFTSARPWISGLIAGWGRVVNGPKGFRCAKATIIALCLPIHEPNAYGGIPKIIDWDAFVEVAVARIREDFPAVPLFESVDHMLDVVPLAGPRLGEAA